MSYTLGVDLGTTFTAAAVDDGSGPVPLKLGSATAAMPSVVAVRGGEPVTGEAAVDVLRTTPAAGVREAKRRLGDSTPFIIDGTPYGAEALMGLVLADVIQAATSQQGEAPTSVVLSHPANWGDFKKDLLSDTARVAGLDDVGLITEPQAAAIHYVRSGELEVGQAAAVYDFGGGTFDAAVVRCAETGPELLGEAKGLERLGGIDLDQAILVHVDNAVDGALRELDASDPTAVAAMAAVREQCVAAKETLSTAAEASVSVALPGLTTDVRLTRTEFEEMLRPRIADTLAQFDAALASAGLGAGDLSAVVLVGGTSRIPLVGEMVAAHTGVRVVATADHKTVVCVGAAAGDAPAAALVGEGADDGAGGAAFVVTGPKGSAESQPEKYRGGVKKRRLAMIGGAAVLGTAGVVAAGGAAVAAGVIPEDAIPDGAMNALDALGLDGLLGDGDGDGASAGAGMRAAQLDEFEEAPKPGADEGAAPSGAGPAGAASQMMGGSPMARAAAVGQRGGGGQGGSAQQRPPARDDDGPSPTRPDAPPAGAGVDPEFAQAKSDLLSALRKWEPPAGVDPADAAEFRAALLSRLERFQPMPGESAEHAAASLQDVYKDQVKDFVQDQRLEDVEDAGLPPAPGDPTSTGATPPPDTTPPPKLGLPDDVANMDFSQWNNTERSDMWEIAAEHQRWSTVVNDGDTKITYGPVQPRMANTDPIPKDQDVGGGRHLVTFYDQAGRFVIISTTEPPEIAMRKYAGHRDAQPPYNEETAKQEAEAAAAEQAEKEAADKAAAEAEAAATTAAEDDVVGDMDTDPATKPTEETGSTEADEPADAAQAKEADTGDDSKDDEFAARSAKFDDNADDDAFKAFATDDDDPFAIKHDDSADEFDSSASDSADDDMDPMHS